MPYHLLLTITLCFSLAQTHPSAAFWNMGEEKGGEEEVGFGRAKEEKGSEGWRETHIGDQQQAADRRKRTAEKWPAG